MVVFVDGQTAILLQMNTDLVLDQALGHFDRVLLHYLKLDAYLLRDILVVVLLLLGLLLDLVFSLGLDRDCVVVE